MRNEHIERANKVKIARAGQALGAIRLGYLGFLDGSERRRLFQAIRDINEIRSKIEQEVMPIEQE